MARSRSLPTDLFDDPDFFDLSSSTQVILLGLVLFADDYGRGLAHSGLLARKCNKAQAVVEQALQELQAADLLLCYPGERNSYYALTRWTRWETLSKPAPSRYPAPPQVRFQHAETPAPEPTDVLGWPAPSERTGKAGVEAEEEAGREEENEGEPKLEVEVPPTQVDVATASATASSLACLSKARQPHTSADSTAAEAAQGDLSQEVATILRLPLTPALSRLVGEYQMSPGLSLLGEADAAREYIETPGRNRRGQSMSLTFFRRWLQREQETTLSRQAALEGRAERGSEPHQGRAQRPAAPTLTTSPALQEVSAYQAFVQRREHDLRQLVALTTEEQRPAALKAYILTGKLPERGTHATHA